MKKRLFAILLALTLALTLLPTAYAAADDGQSRETIWHDCPKCKTLQELEIIGYIGKLDGYQFNKEQHWLHVLCPSCNQKGYFLGEPHSGGTETPTCTTGKTCEKCGGEYGILGHDWGAWVSNGDGKTHTHTCKRDGCTAFETEDCGGDGTATCVTMGTCTDCGQQYYGGHYFATPYTYGYDENTHWHACSYCEEGREAESAHYFIPGNIYLKSKATCISKDVYYTNCGTCNYKGTDTYVYEWSKLDPNNHDGGTEVKNAKAATCTEKGYTGDTYCKGCGVKLEDGTDIPATGHDWAEATCTTPKTCKVCQVTEGNALGHDYGAWKSNGDGTHTRACQNDTSHSETANCSGGTANCHTKAVCEVCNEAYGEFDAANHDGGTEIKDAKDATCTEKGYTGDTYCKGCNAKLTDGKDIPATGHTGGTADCCHKAKCEVCKQEYGEVDPDNHSDLKHIPYKRATTRTEGNIEYWYCSGCGKYYKDAEATKEITQKDTVVRKRRSTFGSSADDDKTVKSVKTGDAGIALYAGMAALSLTGGAWLRRKKH